MAVSAAISALNHQKTQTKITAVQAAQVAKAGAPAATKKLSDVLQQATDLAKAIETAQSSS